MSNRFLFELGMEEIPAWMIPDASRQLAENMEKGLAALGVDFQRPLESYNTPRRLAVAVDGLPERQPDREEVVTGPPRAVAFDEGGRPTKAAEGFARKQGVPPEKLEVAQTEKGEYAVCRRVRRGRPLPELLPEVAERAARQVAWPKNMYWRESRFRYIRPIRWIVALFNEDELELEIEGVRSSRVSWGHRFLGSQRVALANASQYPEKLLEGYVMADVARRRERIEKGIREAAPQGTRALPDKELMEDVVHLNEYPTVIRGGFDGRYLEIPREVLITVMRFHQKYFAVADSKGRLKPSFLTVLNTASDEDGRIRAGHEKVLRARLEDAAFFWQQDRKTPMKERAPQLADVLFQEKLGSYADKARRLEALCSQIAEFWPGLDPAALSEAARLCKADLTTGMVGELPELQGVMGGLYLREEGRGEDVWQAVYQHYRPLSLGDEIPSNPHGAALALADKLDTLAGCFGIGLAPKGSSDPYALRRAAQGIVAILLELGKRVPSDLTLEGLVEMALARHEPEAPPREVRARVLDFLLQRVRRVFEREGLAYDVINAVAAAGVPRVGEAYEKARALQEIRSEEDFEALAAAFKRIRNILGERAEDLPFPDRDLLADAAEKDLFKAYEKARPEVESLLQGGDYTGALKRMAALRRPVDLFFDEVLVMAEDEALRENRLALLQALSALFLQFADISQIVLKD